MVEILLTQVDGVTGMAFSRESLRQALASGSLSVEQEVAIRSSMVERLLNDFDQSGQYHYIPDAIQQLETILRRLPSDSFDRPKYLGSLSYIKISEYTATNSHRALEDAVLNGRRAKGLSVTTDLVHRNPEIYFGVLINFGYALVQRYKVLQGADDLEDAIICAREGYEKAPKNSAQYSFSLKSLASRLHMRYLRTQDPGDINEALRLINELVSRTCTGTIDRSTAVALLGTFGSEKFKQTNKLEDLDEALRDCESGLGGLPEDHEMKKPLHRLIISLFRERYQRTSKEADLRNLTIYSGMLLRNTPPAHAARGQYLLDYLRLLDQSAAMSQSFQHIRKALRIIQPSMNDMLPKYPEQRQCQGVLADIFMGQYRISKDLQDLVACLSSVEGNIADYDDEAGHGDSSQGFDDIAWFWDLNKSIRLLAEAPTTNHARYVAKKELPETLCTCNQSQDSTARALEQLYRQSGVRLKVLAEAVVADRTLSNEEIALATPVPTLSAFPGTDAENKHELQGSPREATE